MRGVASFDVRPSEQRAAQSDMQTNRFVTSVKQFCQQMQRDCKRYPRESGWLIQLSSHAPAASNRIHKHDSQPHQRWFGDGSTVLAEVRCQPCPEGGRKWRASLRLKDVGVEDEVVVAV